jgi:hypothetical protein
MNSITQSRFDNYQWVCDHGAELSKFAGKWIAVADSKLLAAKESMKELLAEPAVKAATRPFLTKVPLPEETVATLCQW